MDGVLNELGAWVEMQGEALPVRPIKPYDAVQFRHNLS
jgi:hypothetical protein